jgi:hypothetical protein
MVSISAKCMGGGMVSARPRVRKDRAFPTALADEGRNMARSKTTEGTTVSHLWMDSGFRAKLAWVAGCIAMAALLLALGSFNSADWPSQAVAVHRHPAANLLGNAGAAIAYWTYAVLGYGVWPVLLLGAAALAAWPFGYRMQHVWLRAIGALLLLLSFGALHAQWFPRLGPVAGIEAGLIPQWMDAQLAARFSGLATSLILLCGAVIGAVVAADEVLVRVPAAVMQGLSFLEPLWKFDWAGLLASFRGGQPKVALAGAGTPPSPAARRKAGAAASTATLIEEDELEDAKRDEEEEEEEDDDFDDEEDEDEEDDDDDEDEAETTVGPPPSEALSSDSERARSASWLSTLPTAMAAATADWYRSPHCAAAAAMACACAWDMAPAAAAAAAAAALGCG